MSQRNLAREHIVESFSAEFGVAPTIVEAVFEKYFGTDFWEREYKYFEGATDESDDEFDDEFDKESDDESDKEDVPTFRGNMTKSSQIDDENNDVIPYDIGRKGEDIAMNLITLAKPDLAVNIVSGTGHVADLHVIDNNTNPVLKYIVEVKNKQVITLEDVNKFNRDLSKFDSANTVGMFLSLRSDAIPKMGTFFISRDEVWLSQKYITKEHLQLIFSIMPILKTVSKEKVQYAIPPEVMMRAANLRMLISKCDENISKLTTQRNRLQESICDNAFIIANEIVSRDIAKALLDAFGIEDNAIQSSAFEKEDMQLREYVSSVKNWTKQSLMMKFPLHSTDLAAKSKKDIIDTYNKTSVLSTTPLPQTPTLPTRPTQALLPRMPTKDEMLDEIGKDTEFGCSTHYEGIMNDGLAYVRKLTTKDKMNLCKLFHKKGWINSPKVIELAAFLGSVFTEAEK